MSDIQRAYSSNARAKFNLPVLTLASSPGWLNSAQARARNRIAWFVLTARDRQFDIGADLRVAQPRLHLDRQKRRVGINRQPWDHRVDMRIDRGGAIVTPGLDRRIANVIGAAVDHALTDPVHLVRVHVCQPGDAFQRLARYRHGKVTNQIAGPARRKIVENAGGVRPKPGLQ